MPPQTRGFPADEAVERGFRQEKSHSRLLCAASSSRLRASDKGRQIDIYDSSDASMLLGMKSSSLFSFSFRGKIAEEERGESNFKIRYLVGVKTIFDCNCSASHFLKVRTHDTSITIRVYHYLFKIIIIINYYTRGRRRCQNNAGVFFLSVSYTTLHSRSKKPNQTSCVVARLIFTRINIPIHAIKRVDVITDKKLVHLACVTSCVFEFCAKIRTPNYSHEQIRKIKIVPDAA